MENREKLKDKKRIVVKVGTSSLIHPKTGQLNLFRLEKLVRVLTDIHNSGKDVILVSSGAIGVGFKALGLKERPESLPIIVSPGPKGPPGPPADEAGLLCRGAGTADDDLSKAVCRVQSGFSPDPYHKRDDAERYAQV